MVKIDWMKSERGGRGGRVKKAGDYLRITKSYISLSDEVMARLFGDVGQGEKPKVVFGTSPDTPGVLYVGRGSDSMPGAHVVSKVGGINKVQAPKRIQTLASLGFAHGEYDGTWNDKLNAWAFGTPVASGEKEAAAAKDAPLTDAPPVSAATSGEAKPSRNEKRKEVKAAAV